MVVFSNRRLGPAVELLVSLDVAVAMLQTTAEAARPRAQGRWEYELVLWLEERARRIASGSGPVAGVDVGEIAWSPENFERQRAFLTDAIARASLGSEHARALALWTRMIAAHPRECVLVGRRWQWAADSAIP